MEKMIKKIFFVPKMLGKRKFGSDDVVDEEININETVFNLALLYKSRKNYEKMKFYFDLEIEQAKNGEAAYIMGDFLFNKFQLAKPYLLKCVDIYNETGNYKKFAIHALCLLCLYGDIENDLSIYARQLFKIDENNEISLVVQACLYYYDFNVRNELFQRIIDKNEYEFPYTLYFIANEYFIQKDYINFIYYIEKYLEKEVIPLSSAYFLLGLYYDLYEKNEELLIENYRKAIAMNHQEAIFNFSIHNFEKHNFIAAYNLAKKCTKYEANIIIENIEKLVNLAGFNRFPKHVETILLNSIQQKLLGDECPICLNSIEEIGPKFCITSCGHIACWDCQIKWYLINLTYKCATCNQLY